MLHKILKYYRNHIWCSFATVFLLSFAAYFTLLKQYMQRQYFEYLQEKTVEAEAAVLESVTTNVEYRVSDLIRIAAEVGTDDEIKTLTHKEYEQGLSVAEHLKYDRILSEYLNSSPYIMSIAISRDDTVIEHVERADRGMGIWTKQDSGILKSSYEAIKKKVITNDIPKTAFLTAPSEYYYDNNIRIAHIAVPLLVSPGNHEEIYMITFSFNTSLFGDYMNKIYQSYKGIAEGYVATGAGQIIYHNNRDLIGTQVKPDPDEIFTLVRNIKGTDWYLHIDLDMKQLFDNVNMLYGKGYIGFMICFGILLCALLGLILFVISRPVKALLNAIDTARNGSYFKKIKISGGNEIWQVAEAFNTLLGSLEVSRERTKEEYTEKVLALQKKQEAEWEALESQINAHFICNTIGSISYEAIEAGNHKVAVLLKKLSNILRYTFDKTNGQVYLYQEVMWLEQYLYLQKLRYEDVFEYSIQIPVEYQEWPAIKLMIQPFVENSIIHGFEGRKNGGKIIVTGEEGQDHNFYILINDNGCGMDPGTADKAKALLSDPYQQKGGGMGIANVELRLRAFYKTDHNVSFESIEGEGTTFRIRIVRRGD